MRVVRRWQTKDKQQRLDVVEVGDILNFRWEIKEYRQGMFHQVRGIFGDWDVLMNEIDILIGNAKLLNIFYLVVQFSDGCLSSAR